MKPLFFYGSLRDVELLGIVLGRAPRRGETRAARVRGHATRRLADETYPMLVPDEGEASEGLLLDPPAPHELERLAFFEGEEFELAPIVVEAEGGEEQALFFRATPAAAETTLPWDYEAWRAEHRALAVEAARELMDHHGRVPDDRIDALWPFIQMRARQRLRARAAEPRSGGIRRPAAPGDVETLELRRPYAGYLEVEELTLRSRRFDGGWVGPVERTAVLWGDAVTVLPYDPQADRLLMIEQFRPAPAARGDRNPWCIEVVAGRIDCDEAAEEVARREAVEEAGVELGRLEPVGGYYPTPGLAAEHLTAFVGEARLPEAGGLHGVETEHEDIRSFVLSFDEAMQAVREGAVNTGPALISLLWLAVNRERLARAWSRPVSA